MAKRLMTLHSRPDSRGRVRFTLFWDGGDKSWIKPNPGRIQAQCFFDNPDKHKTPDTEVIEDFEGDITVPKARKMLQDFFRADS